MLADEFIASQPTVSTDRVCQAITRCNESTHYEQTRATDTSDALCTPLSECALGKSYESRPPTYVSNRVCTPVTRCDLTEVSATLTSDSICTPVFFVPTTFFADYDLVIGENETTNKAKLIEAYQDVVAADFNFSQDVYDSFVNSLMTVERGSIVVQAVVYEQAFQEYIIKMIFNGTLNVMGMTAWPCPSRDEYVSGEPLLGSNDPFKCTPKKRCDTRVEYELHPPGPTTDAACYPISLSCPSGQYEIAGASYSSDILCADIDGEASSAAKEEGLGAGVAAMIAIFCILLVVLVAGFVTWRQRKQSKDRRQYEWVEKMTAQMSVDRDATLKDGNSLLRQVGSKPEVDMDLFFLFFA